MRNQLILGIACLPMLVACQGTPRLERQAPGSGNRGPAMEHNHGKLRELLFADQPLASIANPPGSVTASYFPYSAYTAAYVKLSQGDGTAARAELRRVASAPRLESRQYLWAWHALREMGEQPPAELAAAVQGVVIEVGMERGLDVLAAYSDHRARFLSQGGKMIFWEASDPTIDQRIDALLAATGEIARSSKLIQELRPPAPATGMARVSVLTFGGIHCVQGTKDDIFSINSLTAPVMGRGASLMRKLIDMDRDRGDRDRHARLSGPVLKIAVTDNGSIYLDGAVSSMPALLESLRTLKEHHGTVCFYRRPPVENQSAGALEVFQTIVRARQSVTFSSRPDFSDVVGPNGKLLPK